MDSLKNLMELIKSFNPISMMDNKFQIEKEFKNLWNKNLLNNMLLECINYSSSDQKITIFIFLKHFYGPNNLCTLDIEQLKESFNFWLNYFLDDRYLNENEYLNNKGYVSNILETFKIIFYKFDENFIVNFLNFLINIENKTIWNELKIFNLIYIIVQLDHLKNKIEITKLIMNYIDLNIENLKLKMSNSENYLIISNIISIIYKIMNKYINKYQTNELILFLFNNNKIRDFNLFCYFINYKINENNFFELNENNLHIMKLLKSKIQIFKLFNNFLEMHSKFSNLKFMKLNDFFPIKNFIGNFIDDLEIFYLNNEIGLDYKNSFKYLKIVSLYLFYLSKFVENNFLNDLDNEIFLKFIKLKNIFLKLNDENEYKFKSNPKDFYNDIKDIVYEKKIINIQNTYLKLIEVIIKKIDVFFNNWIRIIIEDFNNFDEELNEINFIMLINNLYILKDRNNILKEIKPRLKVVIDYYFQKNDCDKLKFYILYFIFYSYDFLFNEEIDISFLKKIHFCILKIIDFKIKNNINDSLLFFIIKKIDLLLIENDTFKKIFLYNLNDFLEQIMELIYYNDNLEIVNLLFKILKNFKNYFIEDNIIKFKIFFKNSIEKFINNNYLKTTKIIELYSKLLKFKNFKDNTILYDFIYLFKNSLEDNKKEFNYTNSLIEIIKNFDKIDNNIFNLFYNWMQSKENLSSGFSTYLEILLNINMDEQQKIKILEYLMKLSEEFKNELIIENMEISMYLFLILFLKLIDNYDILNELISKNLLKTIYDNFILISKKESFGFYFSNILNILPIILWKNGFNLDILNIDYNNFENMIINNEFIFCDIFSNGYFVYFLMIIIQNKYQTIEYEKIIYAINKIVLKLNLINLDYNFNIIKKISYTENYYKILNKLYNNFLENQNFENFYEDILNLAKKYKIINKNNDSFSNSINSDSSENDYNDFYLSNIKYKISINKWLINDKTFFVGIINNFNNLLINLSKYFNKNIDELINEDIKIYYNQVKKIKLINNNNNKLTFRKIVNIKKN